jgi:hypothetical protein
MRAHGDYQGAGGIGFDPDALIEIPRTGSLVLASLHLVYNSVSKRELNTHFDAELSTRLQGQG